MVKQVLIVEDDLSAQFVLQAMLKKIDPDAHVDSVQSAESAYRLINDAGTGRPEYDLIMADLKLPGSSGLVLWDLCSKKHPALDFLFMSGITHEEWLRRIKDYKDEPAFLRKPLSEWDLERFWKQRFYPAGEAGS